MTVEEKQLLIMGREIPHNWGVSLINVFAVTIILLIAFWNTFASMALVWMHSDNTYSHGFLIFPISLYLIWNRRHILLEMTPQPSAVALIAIVTLNIFWVIGSLANTLIVQQYSLIIMITAILWALLGREVVSVIIFPLGYLLFAVPFGEFLTPYLQNITSVFTVELLRLTGIPTHLEGYYFSIPTGKFEVAKACSGLRYLIASVAIGVIYAYLNYHSLKKRMLFVAIAILVPVIANVIRAYGIVMIAHLSDYNLATGIDHIIYGWIFFGVVVFLMIWLGSLFRDRGEKITSQTARKVNSVSNRYSSNILAVCTVTCVLVIISGPLAAKWFDNSNIPGATDRLPTLPVLKSSWAGPFESENIIQAKYSGVSIELNSRYEKAGGVVMAYMAYYSKQSQGSELVNDSNYNFHPGVWQQVGDSVRLIKLNNSNEIIEVNEVEVSSKNGKYLLWCWNQIGEKAARSPILTKLLEARMRIFGSNSGSAAIVIVSKIEGDRKDSENLLKEFFLDFYPGIVSSIQQLK